MSQPPHWDEALNRLPHGPEFRFLDRLLDLSPGHSGVAEYTPRSGAEFFKGHFPGEPILPGVLLIEAGAQLAGVVAQCDPAVPPLHGLKLAGVRSAKITGSVTSGETLRIEARIEGRMGGLIQARVEVGAAGVLLLQAGLTLSGQVSGMPGPA